MNLNNFNLNEKIEDLLAALKKKEDEKEKNTVLWVLAIIGAVAAVAGIAFAVYRFFAPDYLEDFEEDFDDDFETLASSCLFVTLTLLSLTEQ